MEIFHRAPVDGQEEVDRYLTRLPKDPIDIIDDKVVTDQYLLCFDMGQLLLFNSSRRAWETVSLDFIQLEGCRMSSCVASDGGLLVLVTLCGKFFVCNPLTRRCKRLQKPPVKDSLISELCTGVRVNGFTSVVADMVANSDTSHFKVVLASIDRLLRRSTLVYDSRADCWREVEDFRAPRTISFFASLSAKYQGDLYVAGHDSADPRMVNVLKYEVEREQWRSAGIALRSKNSQLKIILKINGTLLMGFRIGKTLSFLEVQDTGTTLTLLASTFSLPVARVREDLRRRIRNRSDVRCLLCVGGEDVVYYVGVVRAQMSQTIRVLVRTHNFMDGSDLLSDWEDWTPLAGSAFPLSDKFHIFKPSFLGTFLSVTSHLLS